VPLDAGTNRFQPSNLEVTSIDTGNEAGNVIPARGTARFNVRFNDAWSSEKLTAWTRERLRTVDPAGCAIGFEPVSRTSEVFLSPMGGGVDVLTRTIEETTGAPPELSTSGGTSDARFIAKYCPVVECGLPGPSLHQADEHVKIADVRALAALYRKFLLAYFA
jgi:succinyl-diaminopimelate desuccinylase